MININNQISLTIGIPAYNSEETIRETLDSIVCQVDDELVNYCNLEILICDNCSTDNTPKIIKEEYIKKYPDINIRYHRNKTNVGAPKNIDVVFKNAKGDYVWLCGDDAFYKDSLLYIVTIIKNNDDVGVLIANSDVYCNGIKKKIFTRDVTLGEYNICNNQVDFANYARDKIYFLSNIICKKKYVANLRDQIDFSSSYYPQTEIAFKLSRNYKSIVINKSLIKERNDSWETKLDSDKKIAISFSMLEVLLKTFPSYSLKKIPQYKISLQSIKHFINLYGNDVKDISKIIDLFLEYRVVGINKFDFYLIYILKFFSTNKAYKILRKSCKSNKKNFFLRLELLALKIICAISSTIILFSFFKLIIPIIEFLLINNSFNDDNKVMITSLILLGSIITNLYARIILMQCRK